MQTESMAGLRMVAVANLVFVVGGAAAYQTQLSLALAAVMALVVMLGAVLDLRHSTRSVGMDRALSFTIGALALNAVLVVLPYLTTGEEGSLWDSRLFSGLDLLVAAGGIVLVNHAVFTAAGAVANAQVLAQVHLILVAAAVVALYYIPDGTWVPVEVNDHVTRMLDLRWSPVIAALGSLGWAWQGFQRAALTRSA